MQNDFIYRSGNNNKRNFSSLTTALNEFFIPATRSKLYERVEVLQVDFDTWLAEHNMLRPHQGYPNQGK